MNTETPDWMKSSSTPTGGKDSMGDLELSPVTNDAEPAQDSTETNGSSKILEQQSNPDGCTRKFLRYLNWLISLCFLILFIASAVFQNNDLYEKALWILFFSFHSVTICLYVAASTVPNCLTKPLTAWGLAMIAWSIGMVIWKSIGFAQVKNDGTPSKEDAAFSNYQEKAFKFGGATLGLVSVVYHFVVWKYGCCRRTQA